MISVGAARAEGWSRQRDTAASKTAAWGVSGCEKLESEKPPPRDAQEGARRGGGREARGRGVAADWGGGGLIRPLLRCVDRPEPYDWTVAQAGVWWGWEQGEGPRGPSRRRGRRDVPAAGAGVCAIQFALLREYLSMHVNIIMQIFTDLNVYIGVYTCIYVDISA